MSFPVDYKLMRAEIGQKDLEYLEKCLTQTWCLNICMTIKLELQVQIIDLALLI